MAPEEASDDAAPYRYRRLLGGRGGALLSDHLRGGGTGTRPARPSRDLAPCALARPLRTLPRLWRLAGRGRVNAHLRAQARGWRCRDPDLSRQHHPPGTPLRGTALAA